MDDLFAKVAKNEFLKFILSFRRPIYIPAYIKYELTDS